jgi:hypothetical protein
MVLRMPSAVRLEEVPQLAPTPPPDRWVSQLTCLELLGLNEGEYLARVKSWHLRAVRDGKRVLTRKSDWDALFELRATGGAELTGRDAVLAKLGLRDVRGRGSK